MIKPAFSTVACPEWTLSRVASYASSLGYEGVELRTFGHGSTRSACDPALTAPEKVRRIFADAGVKIAGLATSIAFDEPIRPAVVARVFGDTERTVRAAKSAIDLAAQIECPLVRVFGFEAAEGEGVSSAMARIIERLAKAVDAARNTGVRVAIENGGSFGTASAISQLIARIGDPLLGIGYNNGASVLAGEDPAAASAALAPRTFIARVMDFDADRKPCVIGDGTLGVKPAVQSLVQAGYSGSVVVEWDRSWLQGEPGLGTLPGPEMILPESIKRLYAWASEASPAPARGLSKAR
jgi:sugar phosphate isomerase/epimerase